MPPVKTQTKAPAAEAAQQDSFNQLINENALLFYRLKMVAEEVHHQGEMSGAKRALLRLLEESGAQTVPNISRARNVTRQHMQALVNELAGEGLVEFADNPAHKRSPLVQVTAAGRRFVTSMNRREAKIHQAMALPVSESELRAAARVLKKVRASFENEAWRKLLKQLR